MEHHQQDQIKPAPRGQLREWAQKQAKQVAGFLTHQSNRLSAAQKKIALLALGLVAVKASLVLVLAPILWSSPLPQAELPAPVQVERIVEESPVLPSGTPGTDTSPSVERALDSFKFESPLKWIRMRERRMDGLHTVPGR